jgi:hypothetical protein
VNRIRTGTALAAITAVSLTLAGCHGSAKPGSGDGGKADPQMTPEQSRAEVIDALHNTWRELKSLNVTAAHPYGYYAQCVDQGGAVEYIADVRVDPKLSTDPPLGDRLEPALTAAGWTLETRPSTAETDAVIHAAKGQLTIAIDTYPGSDNHYVLLRILGPCLNVGDADQTYIAKTDKTLPLS